MKKKAVNSSKSGKSGSKSLSTVKVESSLSVEQVLAHPAFQEMSKRLESVQGMLQNLPVAIGQAVASAMAEASSRGGPDGVSGPAIPMVQRGEKDEIEITKGQLKVGKEVYEVPKDGINKMKARHIPGAPFNFRMKDGGYCHGGK